jgi:N-acyl-D-aspartate/D-glutamate deacylase
MEYDLKIVNGLVFDADRNKLIRLMECVQDIPAIALSEGITWEWETLPGYMDTLDAKPHTIDFAVQVTPDPLRMVRTFRRADSVCCRMPAATARYL